jgi:hypothetical protein
MAPNLNNAQNPESGGLMDVGPLKDEDSQADVGLIPAHDHGPEDDSMSALWDDFAAAAPLDIPNWDEWDSLTAGFFTDMT